MANKLSTILVLLYYSSIGICQITGNLNVDDPNAIELNDSTLQLLCANTWHFEKKIEHQRDLDTVIHELNTNLTLNFNNEGENNWTSPFNYIEGTWKLLNKKTILIAPINIRYNSQIAGTWVVYELTDSLLVLGRILTSNADWTKLMHFKSTEVNRPKPNFLPGFNNNIPPPPNKRTFYPSGALKSISKHRIKKIPLTREQAFLFDLDYDSSVITYNHYEPIGIHYYFYPNGDLSRVESYDSIKYVDEYQYLKDGTLEYVKRELNNKIYYIVGNSDSVSFTNLKLNAISKSHNEIRTSFTIKNLGIGDIQINLIKDPKIKLSSQMLNIQASDSIEVLITYELQSGFNDYHIRLENQEWQTVLTISGFGYELTSLDMTKETIIELPRQFYYYRTGNEYQIKIKRSNGSELFYPLSKEKVPFRLKRGKYLFSIKSPTIEYYKQVVVK